MSIELYQAPNAQQAANYIVYTDGTYYYAQNGQSGNLDYGGAGNAGGISGTLAASVINAAITHLSAARTWKEKVVVKGNITIAASITLPSYTILEIQGKITASGNFNLINSSSVTSQVEIRGGIVDGNSGISANHHGINFNQVTDGNIYGVTFLNITSSQCYPVYIIGCTRVNCYNCRADNCDDGFTISAGGGVTCLECNFVNCWHTGIGTTSACFVIIGASDSSHYCVGCNVINCTGESSGNQGVQIYRSCLNCYVYGGYYSNFKTTGVTLGHSLYINTCNNVGAIGVTVDTGTNSSAVGIYAWNSFTTIQGCSIRSVQSVGIAVAATVTNVTITGNTIDVSAYAGCYALYLKGSNCTVTGNTFNGVMTVSPLYYWGIVTTATATNNSISDNQFTNFGYGFSFTASSNANVVHNNIFSNIHAFTDSGYNNVITNNPGYNPKGFNVSTPTVPASTSSQINGLQYPVRIYILSAGTTTAYQITDSNGSTQAVTTTLYAGQEITIDPQAQIQFTYSTAPTWKWLGT